MIDISVKESFLHTDREKVEEDFFQLSGINRSSVGRKTDEETGSDPFFCDLAGGPLQDFLPTVTHRDQTALAGAFGTEGVVADLFFKLSGKIIRQRDAGNMIAILFPWKSRSFVRNPYTDMRRRSKRIPLYVVD